VLEEERAKISEAIELEKAREVKKAEEAREFAAVAERAQALEDYEKMKERALAKAVKEVDEPEIFGEEEMEEEVKHMLMQQTDELRAPVGVWDGKEGGCVGGDRESKIECVCMCVCVRVCVCVCLRERGREI